MPCAADPSKCVNLNFARYVLYIDIILHFTYFDNTLNSLKFKGRGPVLGPALKSGCFVSDDKQFFRVRAKVGLGLGLGFGLGLGLDIPYQINFESAKTVEWFGG